MGWFYTVAQILGWAPTAVRVGWDPKYLGKVTYPHRCLIGPSFIKIPDLVSQTVFMTWKMCLLIGKTSNEFAPIAGPGNWNVSFKIEIFRT